MATMTQTLPSLVKEISQRKIDAYSVVRARSIHTDLELILDIQPADGGFPSPLQPKLEHVLPVYREIVARGNTAFGSQRKVFAQTLRLAEIRLVVCIIFHCAVAHECWWHVGIAHGPARDGRRRGYVPV